MNIEMKMINVTMSDSYLSLCLPADFESNKSVCGSFNFDYSNFHVHVPGHKLRNRKTHTKNILHIEISYDNKQLKLLERQKL